MSEQLKSSNRMENLDSTAKKMELEALVGYCVKIIILPVLIYWISMQLDDILQSQKDIVRQNAELGNKITLVQAEVNAYKLSTEKDHEFLTYRLQILENAYGRIYTRLFEEGFPRPDDSRLGNSPNLKQSNSNGGYQGTASANRRAEIQGSRLN